ncbi:hypothetical protein [Flavobacterium sp.]|uniref:hypothetical protein n=1 Tax=Flavobacterium sp. TaxID=239 RepID=UPI0033400CE5
MTLNELIEKYPDINNATFSSDDISVFTLSYNYPKAFEIKNGEDWPSKVKKIYIESLKSKDLEWISEIFPNVQDITLYSASKIKSIKGLEKLAFLESLYIQKLQNWSNLNELQTLKKLKTLKIDHVGKDAVFNLVEFPSSLVSFDIFVRDELGQKLTEALDFTIFSELQELRIQSASMGSGSSIVLPKTINKLFVNRVATLTDLNFLNNLDDACDIVLRGSELSKLGIPSRFINSKVIPHN